MHAGTPATPLDVVIDTDIGTDVDDILAIAMTLGSPELNLSAATTVYGDTRLRAKMVSRTLAVAGRVAIPVLPGQRETLSGRPVWWPGHEGALFDDLDSEPVAAGDAIELLAGSPRIAAIGPLTNLALAVDRPRCAIEHAVLMGGEFREGKPEHNIRCDVTAADRVFRSGVPVTIVGLDQTCRVRINGEALAHIAEGGALGALLEAEVRQFWRFTAESSNVPHDPIALLTIARPDLFTFTPGLVEVDVESAVTRFSPAADGPHRVVTDMDVNAVGEQIVQRILRAAT